MCMCVVCARARACVYVCGVYVYIYIEGGGYYSVILSGARDRTRQRA
jgi:hypothetical protein